MGVFEALFEFMNTKLSTYVKGNMSLEQLMSIPSINATLLAQALGEDPIEAPVFLYHGTADEFIPLEQALVLREKYNDLGVNTTYMVFAGEHITTQFQAAPFVLSWLKDRFNGVTPDDNSEPVNPRPVSYFQPGQRRFHRVPQPVAARCEHVPENACPDCGHACRINNDCRYEHDEKYNHRHHVDSEIPRAHMGDPSPEGET